MLLLLFFKTRLHRRAAGKTEERGSKVGDDERDVQGLNLIHYLLSAPRPGRKNDQVQILKPHEYCINDHATLKYLSKIFIESYGYSTD